MDFITEEYMKGHIKRVHDEKQHKCNLCDFETSIKRNFTRHQKSKHSVEELGKEEEEEIVLEGMPGFQEREIEVKESFKVKVDLENAKNFKIKYRKPDDNEQDWEKRLGRRIGERRKRRNYIGRSARFSSKKKKNQRKHKSEI